MTQLLPGRAPLTFNEPPLRHWSTWQAEVEHLRAAMTQACRLLEANAAPSAYKVLVDAMRESEGQ